MHMPKLLVFYYSSSGNTEKMARAIAEGVNSNKNVEIQLTYNISVEKLSAFDAILVGTPTYHKQMAMAIRKLLEETSTKRIDLKGKIGSTFGSYGWSGEAPKLVLEILENRLEMRVIKPPIMAKYSPDQNALNACKDLGNKVAKRLL